MSKNEELVEALASLRECCFDATQESHYSSYKASLLAPEWYAKYKALMDQVRELGKEVEAKCLRILRDT